MSRLIDADTLKKDIARFHILNDEAEIRRAYASNPYSTLSDFEDTLVSVFDAIDDAPTIDAVSVEWIPCFDRLPNRQGYYICTCKDGSKYKRTTTVKWSNGWQLTGARAYWVVLAWMPLPKPYERSDK